MRFHGRTSAVATTDNKKLLRLINAQQIVTKFLPLNWNWFVEAEFTAEMSSKLLNQYKAAVCESQVTTEFFESP
jgi:hypothetical protein